MEAIEREELAQKKADDLRSRQLKIFPHQYITKRFVKDTWRILNDLSFHLYYGFDSIDYHF